MAIIDNYRKTLLKKREEISKLNEDLARENEKIAQLQQKIISAETTISHTRSQSTIKSKTSEISRLKKSISDVQKKCSSIQTKIAQKEKEYASVSTKCSNEEAKINKKAADTEKKRTQELQDMARQSSAMEVAIRHQGQLQLQIQKEIEIMKSIPEKITVLFLAANPSDTIPLRLDEEARAIQEKIRLSEYRDSIQFESRWATRASDILQAINETNPTVIHFSGHGTNTGKLVLQNPDGSPNLVSADSISAAIATASSTIRLIFFNTCFSENQASSVVAHIEAAIGTSDSITDEAARTFAAQLYSSIGFGHSLQKAFDQAKAELLLEGIQGKDIPQLYHRFDVDTEAMILVKSTK